MTKSYTEIERQFERRLRKIDLLKFILLTFCFLGGLISPAIWLGIGSSLDSLHLKKTFQLRGSIPAPSNIIVVSIDQALREKYGYPIPRAVRGRVLQKIADTSPKFTVVDTSFPVDPNEPEGDQILAKALSSMPSVIGSSKLMTGESKDSFIELNIDPLFTKASRLQTPMFLTISMDNVISLIRQDLSRSASLYGSLTLAQTLTELGGYTLVKPNPNDLINFYGEPGTIENISSLEVLKKSEQELIELFNNKAVFVGVHDLGEGHPNSEEKFNISASDQQMFGVEIHATTAGNLIERSWIKRFDFGNELIFIFFSSLVIMASVIYLSPKIAYLISASLLLLLLISNFILFTKFLYWVPGILSIASFTVISTIISVIYRYYYYERLNAYIEKRIS